jgi:hypothetical protein
MTEARQRVMGTIGRYGCYFLSIVRAAEKITGQRIDAVQVYNDATLARWMDADCFVVQPDRILEMMTGRKWAIRHDSKTYRPRDGEVMIMRYEVQRTGILYSHFVLCSGDGLVEYDPYGDSSTVKDGAAVSSRIFTRV